MARISTLQDKHRVRYNLYLPDGKILERSRLVTSMNVAREKRAIANELEVKSAAQNYTQRDLNVWAQGGLISRADRERLGGVLPGGGKTLSECFDEWEATWRVGRGEAQARYFRRKNILKILGNTKAIRDLTITDGLALVSGLKAGGLKVATIRKHVQDLKAAFNHQVAARYLNFNPFATLSAGRIPADEKIKHVILTDKQIRGVLDRAEEKDQKARPQLAGTLTLHLLMFFGTGLRRREAQESRLEYINWKERSITLPAEITKTEKPRTVGLGARLYRLLLPRKGHTGYILPRFTPRSLTRAIGKHLRECEIPARLHDARHTYTSMLQDLGVLPKDAMERTGHEDLRMLSHYSHGDFKQVYEDQFDFMQVGNSKKKEKRSYHKKIRDRKN